MTRTLHCGYWMTENQILEGRVDEAREPAHTTRPKTRAKDRFAR